jgi:hypothetical protein
MKHQICLFCLIVSCLQIGFTYAQSSENFDEITVDQTGVSQSTTNPRIFGNWSLGLIDADGNYTDVNNSYLDVTNKTFDAGGTNLANGTNDNAIRITGHLNVSKTFIMKSTDAAPTPFALASFAIDGESATWRAEGWLNGTQVVSYDFTTTNGGAISQISLTDSKWNNIDEFRIEQANGSADIDLYLDDIEISSALPVTLAHFQATAVGSGIQLAWQMGVENTIKSFTIQRSLDGINFTDIASIAVKTAANQHSYQYLDQTPAVGLNYYRIKLISNMEGRNDYSQIISLIQTQKAKNWKVSPNPAQSQVTITAPSIQKTTVTADVINSSGIKVHTEQLQPGNSAWKFSLPAIAHGIYYLNIRGESGHITTLKLIKK